MFTCLMNFFSSNIGDGIVGNKKNKIGGTKKAIHAHLHHIFDYDTFCGTWCKIKDLFPINWSKRMYM